MKYIKSPMNYTGGKFKLLPQIIPLFPKEIINFIDLFAGGLDVAINVEAKNIIANDIIVPMVDMYKRLSDMEFGEVDVAIKKNINHYDLSKTNNDGYLKLRNDYNLDKDEIKLLTLIFYCYNNQIRFNSKWGFNRAFGLNRSEYNNAIKSNLEGFMAAINNEKINFTNYNSLKFKPDNLKLGDFVYADPPYLITHADYSIQATWNEEKERQLLTLLDKVNEAGVKFALSNVTHHHGKSNDILIEWSKKYIIHNIDMSYKNSNAVKKNKDCNSQEVLVTNY